MVSVQIEEMLREEVNKVKRRLTATSAITLSLAIVGAFALIAMAAEVPRITKEEVKEMLGNPDVTIIDVRLGVDSNSNKLRIKGAVREDPKNVSSWIDKYPKDKTLIFYCA